MDGKLVLSGKIEVVTGLHIGGSSAFSAIGAVDSPVVRDPFTHEPIIPGSSLKGKLRTLLSRSMCGRCEVGNDPQEVKRLFGSSSPIIIHSRLQFADCFVSGESQKAFHEIGLTEIKFENAINRISAVANPRQIERVNAGVVFNFHIVYEIEEESEMEEDLKNLAHAMRLLEMDYLGGHGTRGSGRVSFCDLRLETASGKESETKVLQEIFKGVEEYDLFRDVRKA